MVEFFMA